ncbi:hypothetical protein Sango_3098500 [Sesamum angolense]|uniref:DUF4283 domain-containing protein n=1 Tax=Sesamum angolense TaxID=2727404 RepID=A0AAE1T9Q9_9LAMI|nr:hypothetical protein Sango_3098500 [Sesamum angolense]
MDDVAPTLCCVKPQCLNSCGGSSQSLAAEKGADAALNMGWEVPQLLTSGEPSRRPLAATLPTPWTFNSIDGDNGVKDSASSSPSSIGLAAIPISAVDRQFAGDRWSSGKHDARSIFGNIPLNPHLASKIEEDKITRAFNNSSRKTLNFIPPSVQNGEVIVRPSIDMIRAGSKRWNTTAVGYFLGKKPYFHYLNEFVHSIWPGVRDVKATSNGFFFFQFETVTAMEDVIEGGPWLYLGQPIVLQKWEPSMVLRKLKHTEVPVWIKLRHLPVELWTTEGLSTWRVVLADRFIRCDYTCMHEDCPLSKPTKPAVMIYVRKPPPPAPAAPELKFSEQGQAVLVPEEIHLDTETDRTACQGVLINATPQMFPHVEHSDMECEGPEQEGPPSCSPRSCQRIQARIMAGLIELAATIDNVPWLVELGSRSLWKRLDRLLVNDVWMDRWPNLFYTCLTPRTSDHSPLVLKGDCRNMKVSLFRFDNYLALSPGFLASVQSIWRHPVIGTPMYYVTRKLKALKSVFRKQRRSKGDLAMNVKLAAGYAATESEASMAERWRPMLQDRAIDLRYLRPWARHILTDDEARAIIRPVTIDEVKTAFFDIEEDKALDR